MESKIENDTSDSSVDSTVLSKLVKSAVINNSQILGGLTRAGLILGWPAALLGIWIRNVSSAWLQDFLRTATLSLLAVGAGFIVLSQILERTLRTCPICRTRITSKTEEKRRCLECDTELWGYWDE